MNGRERGNFYAATVEAKAADLERRVATFKCEL
jgi:hypothetical protein